jgi:circadian clock protein KaiC
MSESRRVEIRRLPSGIGKLDDVLGGGWPEYSFNLIIGEPGSGKTTMAHQFMFANASAEEPALYFTVLGEPTVKMLRYQQQFSFFDASKLHTAIHFVNLADEALGKGLEAVFDVIVEKVEQIAPRIVIVDSFRTLPSAESARQDMTSHDFAQRLAMKLTSWQATTFLLAEYEDAELRKAPVYTMADGVLKLTQQVHRNSMVRQCRVVKMRGNSPQPGLHTLRISDAGLQAFPRMLKPMEEVQGNVERELISMGIPALDDLLGGGTLRGNAILIAGPVGCGKSTTAVQFIAEGVRRGEPAVLAIFEETTPKYLDQAKTFGFDLAKMCDEGLLEVVYVRPLDLSVDETLYAIQSAIEKLGARRVVLDSITGLEAALAPPFKEDFLESLYRLLGALTGIGITILLTVEVTEPYNETRFTPHPISFLTHDIVLQRYMEIDGQLKTFLTVIKTRARAHKPDLVAYEITSGGIRIGEALHDFKGVLTAVPERRKE